MRIGILTGGGDCPGLNAAIRAVTRRAINSYHYDVWGIKDGWKGLIEGDMEPLDLDSVSGILHRGGTILGTSRTNPFKGAKDPQNLEELRKLKPVQRLMNNLEKYQIEALVVIGGEDTLGVAAKLYQMGISSVGIPKTIDNDVTGTDFTIGFDTAVTIATDAIDRLHSTAESHHRVMVIEVMGRHAGWIATMAGMAGGADCILIPEVPFKISEVCELIIKRHNRGKTFSIIVVAEGAKPEGREITKGDRVDEFGHVILGGVGTFVGKEIEKATGIETRVTTLGHIQRGGPPTAYDRALATHFGIKAVDLIKEGKFGHMVGLQGGYIKAVPYEEIVGKTKQVDMELYNVAKVFFG